MPAITSDNPMKPILVKYYRDKYQDKVRINGLKYNKKENYYAADILIYVSGGRYEVLKRDDKIDFEKFNNNLLTYQSSLKEAWRLWGVGFYSKKTGGDGTNEKHPDLPDKYWK